MGVQIYPDNGQMTDAPLIQLTFAVDDPELEAQERQAIAHHLNVVRASRSRRHLVS